MTSSRKLDLSDSVKDDNCSKIMPWSFRRSLRENQLHELAQTHCRVRYIAEQTASFATEGYILQG